MVASFFTIFPVRRGRLATTQKVPKINGGGRGIRTHETLLSTGFQDQLHRPLGQTSAKEFSGYCKNSSPSSDESTWATPS